MTPLSDLATAAPRHEPAPGGPRRTIAVAMSGGVDSSVAAALCVAAGHHVVGIMLRLWSEPGADDENKCCTAAAVDDARLVADALDIPFTVLDAEDAFKSVVVDDFLAHAAAGDTPNPCFGCNRRMRFGYLLDRALALGADGLATGHYARVRTDAKGAVHLHRGVDPAKDQSYVLHRLGQEQLRRAVFPLGELTKGEVRAIAETRGLHVARRSDSVDLCWVGPEGLGGFLARHAAPATLQPGAIRGTDGRLLGRHDGLARYTVGQRRGLGVAVGEPVYVVRRDGRTNELVVGAADELLSTAVPLRDLTWVAGAAPTGWSERAPLPVDAKIRYGAQPSPALLRLSAGGPALEFAMAQRAPTPGQGAVLYDGDEVLGGGTIA